MKSRGQSLRVPSDFSISEIWWGSSSIVSETVVFFRGENGFEPSSVMFLKPEFESRGVLGETTIGAEVAEKTGGCGAWGGLVRVGGAPGGGNEREGGKREQKGGGGVERGEEGKGVQLINFFFLVINLINNI